MIVSSSAADRALRADIFGYEFEHRTRIVVEPADYARIDDMDELRMEHVRDLRVDGTLTVENVTKGIRFEVGYDLSELDIETLRAGGTLNLIRAQQ